jgi:hypothetical protein
VDRFPPCGPPVSTLKKLFLGQKRSKWGMHASTRAAFNPIQDMAFKVWGLFILLNHVVVLKDRKPCGVAKLLQHKIVFTKSIYF